MVTGLDDSMIPTLQPVGALLHRRRLDDGATWHSILTIAERPGEPGRATALLVLQRE